MTYKYLQNYTYMYNFYEPRSPWLELLYFSIQCCLKRFLFGNLKVFDIFLSILSTISSSIIFFFSDHQYRFKLRILIIRFHSRFSFSAFINVKLSVPFLSSLICCSCPYNIFHFSPKRNTLLSQSFILVCSPLSKTVL